MTNIFELVAFSTRLNTALGDDETGIWDGEPHTGLAYFQWTGKNKKRVLLPIFSFIPDKDDDFTDLCSVVYAASDEAHWNGVDIHIDGKWYARGKGRKRHIVHLSNPKQLVLIP